MSSKKHMPNKLDLLGTIEKVQAPDALYNTLMRRIQEQYQIPWWRVGVAAAILVCMIVGEIYLVNQIEISEDMAQVAEIVELPNNNFYYE